MASEIGALEAMERYAPLGPDFLTWIAFSVLENRPPELDGVPLDIAIKGPIVLVSAAGEATKVTLAGEESHGAPEFRSAIAEGKKLVKARLTLTEGADQFEFTFNGETFDFGSVKLPVPKVPDLDQYVADRVTAFQKLADTFDRLYEQFLALRLSPENWKREAATWRKWAKGTRDVES